jgi:hypothetical protein
MTNVAAFGGDLRRREFVLEPDFAPPGLAPARISADGELGQ